MSRIAQLPPQVVNKIAAGEVIERPASVVKETLENSIDALASRITVEIEQGGADLIRITDDGEGIHPEDFDLAITSHATSKIRSDEDLFRVHSMGFRGEALASIASVSRCRLRSRRPEAEIGHEMEVEGGRVVHSGPAGGPVGTTVEIRDLFGNTPVRRKFLKTPGTEFGHISEQFSRIALAHPRLHLVLQHNGRIVHELPAGDDLRDRLRLLHGEELTEGLIRVESDHDGYRFWGYAAHPSHTKSTRKGQYLFLNGRFIHDRALQHAITEAYRGLVMVGRHPVVFLFLEIPPDQVDVNVHPSKVEVRFRDGQRVYRQTLGTLRTEFLKHDLDSTLTVRTGESEDAAEQSERPPLADRQREAQRNLVNWAQEELASWTPTERIAPEQTTPELPSTSTHDSANGFDHPSTEPPPTPIPGESHSAHESDADSSPLPAGLGSRVLQVNDCYLVTETEDGLTVIDQHALHERILYEQFRERVLAGSVESQRLLIPEPIELSTGEVSLLVDHAELLAELGFEIEAFGAGTILLRSYPVLARRAKGKLPELVRDLAERLDRPGKSPDRRELIDSLLHTMACRAAIKSGQRLAPEEIDRLLALRHLIDDAHHCPHGRPTALVLSRDELDRQFGRLGAH